MKFKEIKDGMVIHCNNYWEKRELLEEAKRLGYLLSSGGFPTSKNFLNNYSMTIHFYKENGFHNFKHISCSNRTEDVIEFSDIVIPEITPEEVIDWFREYYGNSTVMKFVFGYDYSLFELLNKFTSNEICLRISNWKKGNEINDKIDLKKVAEPLVSYIKNNYNPHCYAIVTSTDVEILEGVKVEKF